MGEPNRVRRAPAAIGVDGQHEIGAGRAARRLHAPSVLFGCEPAHLELAAGHAGGPVSFHFAPDVRESLALHVVPADGDDRQFGAVAAEQRAHALADGFADEIPEGAVDTGDGFEQRLAVALRVAECEHRLPETLTLEDARTADERRELVGNDADDLAAVAPVVAVVDL